MWAIDGLSCSVFSLCPPRFWLTAMCRPGYNVWHTSLATLFAPKNMPRKTRWNHVRQIWWLRIRFIIMTPSETSNSAFSCMFPFWMWGKCIRSPLTAWTPVLLTVHMVHRSQMKPVLYTLKTPLLFTKNKSSAQWAWCWWLYHIYNSRFHLSDEMSKREESFSTFSRSTNPLLPADQRHQITFKVSVIECTQQPKGMLPLGALP